MPPRVSDYPRGSDRNNRITYGWHLKALFDNEPEYLDDWALAPLPYQDEPCRTAGLSLTESYDSEHLRTVFLLAVAREDTKSRHWLAPDPRMNVHPCHTTS